jgi:2-oxoglutarate dehydrogenase E2 component (dihydrolipoamide succinyltransferase)
MPAEVRVPTLGESVREGVIVRWIKEDGSSVQADEPLLELETDKANVEITAERAGILRIVRAQGETVQVGEVVGRLEDDGAGAGRVAEAAVPAAAPAAPPAGPRLAPAARRLVAEQGLDLRAIARGGAGGRITKADVLRAIEGRNEESPAPAPSPAMGQAAPAPAATPAEGEGVRRVPMTTLRRRIAERLVQAQHTAAILTTFNEIDMSAVIEWRSRHKERFAKVHGVSLGFVSFFARACALALRDLPIVNAQIDGPDVVYFEHVNLGVAVATERGLVVPVIREAETLSLAEIERALDSFARRARDGKLGIADLSGGTFTISNGGVFGSLLSTPILNPPQSAILGMHKIEKRPVVVDDSVAVRPMMYVALSYDHRLIDGEQAVTFLVRVKERLEDPSRLLLEI